MEPFNVLVVHVDMMDGFLSSFFALLLFVHIVAFCFLLVFPCVLFLSVFSIMCVSVARFHLHVLPRLYVMWTACFFRSCNDGVREERQKSRETSVD